MVDSKVFVKISRVLSFVLKSKRSDFYRNKYKEFDLPKTIKSHEDFLKLPFLLKEDLVNTGPLERLFFPFSKVIAVEPTSGTTGVPLIMLTLSYPQHQKTIWRQILMEFNVRRILILAQPINAYHRSQLLKMKKLFFSIGDPRNLNLTARVAAELNIDAIRTSVSLLSAFIPYLEKVYDLNMLKYILLGGEFCTSQRLNFLRKKLPKAEMQFHYGGAETRGRGYQCKFLSKINPQYFHPFSNFYFEFVDEKNNVLPEGLEGEIVVSSLVPDLATPLLRYKTGDLGFLKKKKCKCGEESLLVLKGRSNYDSLKVGGTVIHAQSLQNAISRSLFDIDDYKLHVYEKERRGKIFVELVLEVALRNKKVGSMDLLAKKVSENLFLTPTLTLEKFVEKEIFLPLTIKIVKDLGRDHSEKRSYIVSHLK